MLHSLVLDVCDESQREATRLCPLYQRNVTLDDPKRAESIKNQEKINSIEWL